MISTNIDIGDRLINGHIRTMKHEDVKQNEVTNIYLALQAPMLDILKLMEVMLLLKIRVRYLLKERRHLYILKI